MRRKLLCLLALGLILGSVPSLVGADPLTLSNTVGNLSAEVIFDTSGTDLIVTLTNTSPVDVMNPSGVLTAVFFTLAGDPGLTPVSALLNGSVVLPLTPDSVYPDGGGNVGGEWAYANALSGAPYGADEGISSSGFGLFGAANFGGADLQGPAAVNGLNYGITSAGDNILTGNTPVTGGNRGEQVALIQNSVIFTLSGLSMGFDPSGLDSITDVSFQYGTSLNEPNVPVHEPTALLLLGAGLVGIVGFRKNFLV